MYLFWNYYYFFIIIMYINFNFSFNFKYLLMPKVYFRESIKFPDFLLNVSKFFKRLNNLHYYLFLYTCVRLTFFLAIINILST